MLCRHRRGNMSSSWPVLCSSPCAHFPGAASLPKCATPQSASCRSPRKIRPAPGQPPGTCHWTPEQPHLQAVQGFSRTRQLRRGKQDSIMRRPRVKLAEHLNKTFNQAGKQGAATALAGCMGSQYVHHYNCAVAHSPSPMWLHMGRMQGRPREPYQELGRCGTEWAGAGQRHPLAGAHSSRTAPRPAPVPPGRPSH